MQIGDKKMGNADGAVQVLYTVPVVVTVDPGGGTGSVEEVVVVSEDVSPRLLDGEPVVEYADGSGERVPLDLARRAGEIAASRLWPEWKFDGEAEEFKITERSGTE